VRPLGALAVVHRVDRDAVGLAPPVLRGSAVRARPAVGAPDGLHALQVIDGATHVLPIDSRPRHRQPLLVFGNGRERYVSSYSWSAIQSSAAACTRSGVSAVSHQQVCPNAHGPRCPSGTGAPCQSAGFRYLSEGLNLGAVSAQPASLTVEMPVSGNQAAHGSEHPRTDGPTGIRGIGL
jgi:hypothetical protein